MAVKAVDMVRKIRDRHYEETKDLSIDDQIKFINEKSIQFQKFLQGSRPSTAGHVTTQATNV